MLLDSQCILRQKLNQHLILQLILLLAHLYHHVLLILRYACRLAVNDAGAGRLMNVHRAGVIYSGRVGGCGGLRVIRRLKEIATEFC